MHTKLLAIYTIAAKIRAFENAVAQAADEGLVPGLAHLCLGAEVLQATIGYALDKNTDQITGSHRSHGLVLAAGAPADKVAAEILGKETGLSNGLGGTQHLFAPQHGFLASNGIVGAQVPLAAGAALTAKTLNTGGIAICFFGDGAANQGAVLETMNLAVVLQLPLLFILENNGYGQTTSVNYAAGGISLVKRAEAFGLPSIELVTNNITKQIKQLLSAVETVRTSQAPLFIEVKVPRLTGHYHGEGKNYSAANTEDDPLINLEAVLKNDGALPDGLQTTCKQEMKDALAKAIASPEPTAKTLARWRNELGAIQ